MEIFIVEDHPIMREVLREILQEQPDFKVCGHAGTAEEALSLLIEAKGSAEIDVVLIDLSLPKMNGIDLIRSLVASRPALRCLVLSGHGEGSYVRRALEAGAQGYILKGNPYELLDAIRQVAGGEQYFSEPVKELLMGS